MRLAKIVATLGPGSQSPEMIAKLMDTGVNVFRLNFSHGNHDILKGVIDTIRQLSDKKCLPISILADLQGPKFRIGELVDHEPIFLEKDANVKFAVDTAPGDTSRITTSLPDIIEEVSLGDEILLNDGAIALAVIDRISPKEVICRVIHGGLLGEKKGINVPGIRLANLAALTEKDKIDAQFALEHDVDFIALSFVRSAKDIDYLRQFISDFLPLGQRQPLIVAKIEKPQALDDIDAIIEATDALMVARGDLGVELKLERVPIVQKMLIEKANLAQKPVITATQMLESMINAPVPTRAEVSDVANAVLDGTDALMLSAETAVGQYPVEAVDYMSRIIREAESSMRVLRSEGKEELSEADPSEHAKTFHQAIAQAACYAAVQAHAKAIAVLSYSGSMAIRIAKKKPMCPIIALTPHKKVSRLLNLVGGVYPIKITAPLTSEEAVLSTETAIMENGLLSPLDPMVFCAGQTHLKGLTNSLKLYQFGEILEQHDILCLQRPKVLQDHI